MKQLIKKIIYLVLLLNIISNKPIKNAITEKVIHYFYKIVLCGVSLHYTQNFVNNSIDIYSKHLAAKENIKKLELNNSEKIETIKAKTEENKIILMEDSITKQNKFISDMFLGFAIILFSSKIIDSYFFSKNKIKKNKDENDNQQREITKT